jgi:dihydrofolate synthase/folylpolyglutamate synthase
MEVIEARAAALGAPLIAYGQHWHVGVEAGRLVYQDDTGLLDLPLPNLPGTHQVMNAGAALAALRHLGCDEAACEAAVSKAFWPARMQRLKAGPLVEAAPQAELWLDGGHNPAAGEAIAQVLASGAARPTYMICGMLNTKDIAGYLRPMAPQVAQLYAVSIPGEVNTLPAAETAKSAKEVGMQAHEAGSVAAALQAIVAIDPSAKVLICGSLYLAGNILQENS